MHHNETQIRSHILYACSNVQRLSCQWPSAFVGR
nr:MAG TPA: hypothetical protein [Herelleviridae sp.]